MGFDRIQQSSPQIPAPRLDMAQFLGHIKELALGLPLPIHPQPRPSGKGFDPPVQSVGFRHMPPYKESSMSRRIGRGINPAPRQQRLDLGRRPQSFAVIGHIKRLNAKRITSQQQPLLFHIPQGKGKHAAQPAQHVPPHAPVQDQQHFGVGMGTEDLALTFQFGA